MAYVALILSLFVAALGGIGIVSPERLLSIVRQFQSQAGLYAAAILRIVLGVALFLAAPTSSVSEESSMGGPPAFQRVWAASALACGVFLAYAVIP